VYSVVTSASPRLQYHQQVHSSGNTLVAVAVAAEATRSRVLQNSGGLSCNMARCVLFAVSEARAVDAVIATTVVAAVVK
jgi:hypothetical protein